MFKGMKEMMTHYHELVKKLNSTIIQYINGMNVMKAFNLSANLLKTIRILQKNMQIIGLI